MIYINLMPWRERRRAERQKQFQIFIGLSVLAGAALVFSAYSYMGSRIDHQNQRNQMLQSEIRTLDRQIARIRELDRERRRLVERIEIVQTLQASRPEAVHLFDQIVLTLPDGTFYRELRQQGNRIRLVGRAESNARISALMRSVDASPWLRDSQLEIIETRQEGRLQVRDFRLEARQSRPGSGQNAGGG